MTAPAMELVELLGGNIRARIRGSAGKVKPGRGNSPMRQNRHGDGALRGILAKERKFSFVIPI
ncbi:MAG: hypothetical protein PVI06_06505 [Desulfobacterales bacterium]